VTLPLPDDARVTLTVGELRAMLEAEVRPERPEVVTTTTAESLWSYSAHTWSNWCREGKVDGAWQDGEGGIWRMPYESCAARVERVRWEARRDSSDRRSGPRGPWKASSSQARRPRPESVQEGKVVGLRLAALGRGETDCTRPDTSGMARPGGAHHAPGGGG
jgi:hypothetical protein